MKNMIEIIKFNINSATLALLERIDLDTKKYFLEASKKHVNPTCNLEEYTIYEVQKLREIFLYIVDVYLKEGITNYKQELTNVGFPKEFVANLPLDQHVNFFNECVLLKTKSTSLIKWRIDISLNCNSGANNAVYSSIIMKIHLDNEESVTFITDIPTFHKLRYNIALILKEITVLKQSNKIAF